MFFFCVGQSEESSVEQLSYPRAEIVQTWVHLKLLGTFAGIWSQVANQTDSMNIQLRILIQIFPRR